MDAALLTESLRETLAVFDGSGTPLTTPEVADRLDLGRRTAYARLERLAEQDALETKKVGASARVWWRPRDDDPPDDGWAAARGKWAIGSREEEFRSLVEATEEYAIFLLDPDGHVRTWNPGAARIKGYETDDIVGEHFSTFYDEDDRAADVPERNLELAAEEGSVTDEGWRLRKDGSRFWANVTITAIRNDDGDLEGFAKVTRDMTDRREYERQLREEKTFVENVLDTQGDVLYAFDADGRLLRWNDSLTEATGYADDEIERMELAEFIAAAAHEEIRAAVRRVFEDGEQMRVELPLETADGERIPYEFTGGPLTGEDGEIVGLTGMGRDISERKARERRLERRRDELQAELDDVFARIDDAFFALDEEWRFTYLNERAHEVINLDEKTLVGTSIWEAFPEAVSRQFKEQYEQAMYEQETVTFEEYYPEPLNAWFEVTAYPSAEGLSVYFRDVTDRKEHERELAEARRRYRTLLENFPNGAVTLVDRDCRYTAVGGETIESIDATGDELEGTRVDEHLPPDIADVLVPRYEAAIDGEESTVEATFGDHTYRIHTVPVRDDEGEVFAALGMSQDVTERRERERELVRYETLFEGSKDVNVVVDPDGRLQYVTPSSSTVFGYDPEELVGDIGFEYVHPEDRERMMTEFARMVEDPEYEPEVQFRFVHSDGSWIVLEGVGRNLLDDPDIEGFVIYTRDVTEHTERQRELEARIRQQSAVTELSQRALEDPDLDALMAEAAAVVAETLDNDYCKVLELDAEGEHLRLRQGVGWDDGIVGSATVSAVEADSQAACSLATEEPVVVEDLLAESRLDGPDLLRNHDVRSGISTIIGPPDDPWGILGTHDTDPTDIAEQDATFVQAIANVLAAAIDRRESEQELIEQREQLAALNSLGEVVRDITGAVIEQSTREEIERTVCERLAETDSYLFAWIGEVDTVSQTVTLRVEAGVEGYLDGVTISVDPDDERSKGATGRALRTGEVAVTNDIAADPRYEPWRQDLAEYRCRSSAAIPIVHEGTVYGALNVYADRPGAFNGQEREMVTQLGEVVGQAIAAAERKQALLSDELVELEFRGRDVFDRFELSGTQSGTISIEHAVEGGDGEFLVYGTATEDGVETLARLVEDRPGWETIDVDAGGDQRNFEVRMVDPPILSTVASRGGYVHRSVIEDGDLSLTIHLAPSVDVRGVIDAVTESFPNAEMQRRRQISRESEGGREFHRRLASDLTDRQRTVLDVAYHAGFFDWPREATGEEVAASIDVAPSTFHQHLRKAQRKVFDSVFDSSLERLE